MNKTDFLVLALLTQAKEKRVNREGKMYGYEMMEFIDRIDIEEWTEIRATSIYKSFDRLLKKEYISKEKIVSSKNPTRNVYTILPAGKEVFYKNVVLQMLNPRKKSRDFMIALSFMTKAISKKDFLKAANAEIVRKEATINKKKEILKKIANPKDVIPFHVKYLTNMGIQINIVILNTLKALIIEAEKNENKIFFKEDEG